MASPGTQPGTAKGSPISSREKRQPWQSQMSDVDFQLSLLAKYAGIEFHPQVLEIILDLIRMNVSIPMLAKMIKLMCAQKAVTTSQVQNPNSVKSQNENTNSVHSLPTMENYRSLIVSSSAYSSESSSASHSNSSNRNADITTPNRPALSAHNLVTTRPTRTKTASRVLKK